MTEGNSNRAAFPLGVVFLHMDASMLTLVGFHAHRVMALNHASIGADIHNLCFGISSDYRSARSDVTSAVQFVPARGWKFPQVDVFINHGRFKKRAFRDFHRRGRAESGEALGPQNR